MKRVGWRLIWMVVAVAAVGAALGGRDVTAQVDDPLIPNATVRVRAYGPFGERMALKHARVRLLSADRKREFGRQGRDAVITDVPYGSYTLSVVAPGEGGAERTVVVNTREAWVCIGFSFPAGETLGPGGFLAISGEIRPMPRGGDWWVRADGLFLQRRAEALVSSSGGFSVGGLEMGTYLVEVFEGSRLRHTETVEIDPKRPNTHLTISVPQEGKERRKRPCEEIRGQTEASPERRLATTLIRSMPTGRRRPGG